MQLLRFADLKARKIVNNRMTLTRWMQSNGFPQPLRLGANSVAWSEAEVMTWLSQRAADRSTSTAA
jgi:predicted DNA-binding transcriptional regulator AlpA